MLCVEGLGFDVGGRTILDRVSFEIGRGELAVVMGASGSGKTTLLRCINRLIEPTRGRIALDGTDATTISPVELRRRIRMVAQIPFMFEGTVRENLQRAAGYTGTPLDDEACMKLLEPVAFDRGLDSDARLGSVGQQQRVALARALVGSPAVLLCDEPTASLDEDTTVRLETALRRMCDDGLTVVFVTHDRAQADRIADRTFVLETPSLRETGSGPRMPPTAGRRIA